MCLNLGLRFSLWFHNGPPDLERSYEIVHEHDRTPLLILDLSIPF